MGNQNAAYRGKNQGKAIAVAKANRLLDKITLLAVRRIKGILENPDSTNMDITHAARAVLDRRIPTVTRADVEMHGAPQLIVQIPGFNWPQLEVPQPILDRLGNT
jgi:hypothetical protein